ncbi:unnamed protein product [Lymnaea stagnalis]|uniref:C2H2-type domain-containing protein n=1 Tax=Lymnaea stagnalis TaxID=6523 RepID=A0AAV2I1P9_LYMST
MENPEASDVIVKKEPNEGAFEEADENTSHANAASETAPLPMQGQLRYVSRRGRPPGGGYSMKTHSHYINFAAASNEMTRQTAMAAGSSLSPQELFKSNPSVSSDGIDIRRFGFHGFDSDKNAFRCDGCDVVFSSRDTYAMHMLLRAKNESCVALPTSAISPNPENPTPREKFERELRQQAMISALRSQAAAMSKAAAAMLPKPALLTDTLSQSSISSNDDIELVHNSIAERALSFSSLFSVDAFGVYIDPRQYRRLLEDYGIRTSASTGALSAMMDQLSCSVCGELFSNKDALAMHMMYHTRDEDKEVKPNVIWTDLSAGMSKNPVATLSPSSSTSSSAMTSASKDSVKVRSSERREKAQQSQDRELTAERVAELKRMAIESSLRSPSKKASSSSKSMTRPKSVSQDTAVTSSAQTRPLSADDAMLFAYSGFKNSLSSRDFIKSQAYKEFYDAERNRKRSFSKTEDDVMSEEGQNALEATKQRRMRGDGDIYDFCSMNGRLKPWAVPQPGEKNPTVCDNHVSSASGPQDSDDTSEGSSVAEQDTNGSSTYSGTRSHPGLTSLGQGRSIQYLHAIMSQEAVLVPLETLDSDVDTEKSLDERAESRDISKGSENSAIDFSIGARKNLENRTSLYSTPNDNGGSGLLNSRQADEANRVSPNRKECEEARRGCYQHGTGMVPSGEHGTPNRGHAAAFNGTSFGSSPRRSGYSHQQAGDRATRAAGVDSPSRPGEARYCPHCEILFLDVTLFHLHMGLHNVNNPWQCNTCGLVCAGRLEFNTHVLHY